MWLTLFTGICYLRETGYGEEELQQFCIFKRPPSPLFSASISLGNVLVISQMFTFQTHSKITTSKQGREGKSPPIWSNCYLIFSFVLRVKRFRHFVLFLIYHHNILLLFFLLITLQESPPFGILIRFCQKHQDLNLRYFVPFSFHKMAC